MTPLSKEELIAFEKDIEQEYLAGHIHAQVHFSGGNEEQLIKIFQDVKERDWVFSTHRSHYHALLKGINPHWLKAEILAGRSMHLYSREHRFVTSSIVNGCTPQAVGVALALGCKGGTDRVWCFVGDMASSVGIFDECFHYARSQQLPITFVVENNELSTNTPTREAWGLVPYNEDNGYNLIGYDYKRVYPHIGVGKFVEFK
jgi:TPP-dependent pyruvate/acetoin dehydrogenase alpha subunit